MNENHKRALGTGLRVVERELRSIREDLIQGKNSECILYRKVDDMHDEERDELRGIVSSMLDEIVIIKEKFKLKRREEPVRSDISGLLGEIWVMLEAFDPKRLNNYGKFSEADKDSFAGHLATLLKLEKKAEDCIR
jgi:hypothetical protein